MCGRRDVVRCRSEGRVVGEGVSGLLKATIETPLRQAHYEHSGFKGASKTLHGNNNNIT